MSNPYLGEIRMFAGDYAPANWAMCNGQLLPISQNTALFSLLRTWYGGDGKTTFALPDLQGTVPIAWGQGTGLTPRVLGDFGGTDTVTLDTPAMPNHAHALDAYADDLADISTPGPAVILGATKGLTLYSPKPPDTALNTQALAPAGRDQAHNNLQPYLAVTFIISLKGDIPHPAPQEGP